ncbi:twin-arginine translocase TatA/TatE family subunit [Streptomyces sp. NPDC003470]
MFGLSELAIILVVVIAVLAAKRLPDLARSAGKSARILKAEARAAKDEQAPAQDPGTPRVIPGEAVRREDTGDTGTGAARGGAQA